MCSLAILTDILADIHIFLPSTDAHSQNLVKLTLGFIKIIYNNNYNNNNVDWAKRIKDETRRALNTNSNNNNKKTNNNDQASHTEMAATTIHINSSNNNDDKSDSNDEASYMKNTKNR